MNEVRVGVVAAEVGERRAVPDRTRGRPKFALENRMRVRTGDSVHGVEGEPQARRKGRAQRREIEQLAHQLNVIGHGIDDLNLRIADAVTADLREVDIGSVQASVSR